ncbi:MAG TPA: hypothetical protein VHL53_16350 [Acidimicrobiia bacterium]|nr:hypothetical protein [Acidimicrobiia bacterium]
MKRLTAAVATTLAVVIPATGAFAAWSATISSGSGRSAARTLPAASGSPTAAPTPALNSGTVRVTFATASFPGATLSYAVNRYAAPSGGTALASTACATSPCTIAVPDGTWYFDAAPALQNWRGTATATRAMAVVDTTGPTVTVVLANGGGNSKIDVSGTASTTDGKVTVFLCRSTPCSSGNAAQTLSNLAVAANGSYSATANNPGTGTWYATATQTDAVGNVGTATAGPFVR